MGEAENVLRSCPEEEASDREPRKNPEKVMDTGTD